MLRALSLEHRAEIERRLRLARTPADTAADRRIGDLGALAQMLADVAPDQRLGYPVIEAKLYDAMRPQGAPTAETMAKKFDGWLGACRAAGGFELDGSWSGTNPWENTSRGKPRVPPYSREEIIAAIRRCARERCVVPTSSTYDRWAVDRRARAARHGIVHRIPRAQQIYRHYPKNEGGWAAALADAAIDADEIARARSRKLGIVRPSQQTE